MSYDIQETIYDFASLHEKYKDIFDSPTESEMGLSKEFCNNIIKDNLNYNVNDNFADQCAKGIIYVNALTEKPTSVDVTTECKYLSYRLYDEVNNHKNGDNTTLKLYNALFSGYDVYSDRNICNIFTDYINDDIYQKIEKLIELYTNFKRFQTSQKTSSDYCSYAQKCSNSHEILIMKFCLDENNSFCEELEKFKEKYDSGVKSVNCPNIPKSLTSIKRYNIGAITSITISLILVIPFATFFLLKFTPFGSWLHPIIKKKKKEWKNLNKGVEIFLDDSEGENSNRKDSIYHISYII
ncbi:PIR Superfamily Protein [Plasmodium ovale wallikeri]|uniref:PIR Superfamily Protein n=1 Tax=Plasmodium ovale wallikeri TaxID=864142 RepID=A0A1A9AQN1_PLAOA|nr:PIR Superfamily Protein [Plasmodium ovale wallikeri]